MEDRLVKRVSRCVIDVERRLPEIDRIALFERVYAIGGNRLGFGVESDSVADGLFVPSQSRVGSTMKFTPVSWT